MRNVIREHHFERDLRALWDDPMQADEFVAAAEWVLAEDPHVGLPVRPGSDIWGLPVAPVSGMDLAIFYAFDNSTVWLIALSDWPG